MEIMADAVDAREVDQQPEYEASLYNYFYFVIFIVCGSFFTLNLFIGVIIDNFNALKKKVQNKHITNINTIALQYEGGVLEMFLTESQKHYYTAMKKLGRKKPQKVIKRPQNPYHALFYDISLSRRFEIAIFVLIFLNMVSMGIEHYDQSRAVTFALEICNALFTTIFSLGALAIHKHCFYTKCIILQFLQKTLKGRIFVQLSYLTPLMKRHRSYHRILVVSQLNTQPPLNLTHQSSPVALKPSTEHCANIHHPAKSL